MINNALVMMLCLFLDFAFGSPVRGPTIKGSDAQTQSNIYQSVLETTLDSTPINTNVQSFQEQIIPRRRKTKEQIAIQTKKRAERRKNDPEFKLKVAKQQSKSYHKNKWKKIFPLSKEEIKAKNQESLNKRREKYGGYTSSKEQKYYETKARMYDGYPVTQEDREFVEQYRKKRTRAFT